MHLGPRAPTWHGDGATLRSVGATVPPATHWPSASSVSSHTIDAADRDTGTDRRCSLHETDSPTVRRRAWHAVADGSDRPRRRGRCAAIRVGVVVDAGAIEDREVGVATTVRCGAARPSADPVIARAVLHGQARRNVSVDVVVGRPVDRAAGPRITLAACQPDFGSRSSTLRSTCTILRDMIDFVLRRARLRVIDRGPLGPDEIVFMSQNANDHHQVAFVTGREAGFVEQRPPLAFRSAGTLDDLKALKKSLEADDRVTQIMPLCHGNAGRSTSRPEFNGVEVFIDTPWHVRQPQGEPLDLDKSNDEIVESTRSLRRAGVRPDRRVLRAAPSTSLNVRSQAELRHPVRT